LTIQCLSIIMLTIEVILPSNFVQNIQIINQATTT
jgi:hypothetical protein